MLRESLPFWLAGIFSLIYARADVVLLKLLSSDAEVGAYRAAGQLVEVVRQLPVLLLTALFPQLARAFAEPGGRLAAPRAPGHACCSSAAGSRSPALLAARRGAGRSVAPRPAVRPHASPPCYVLAGRGAARVPERGPAALLHRARSRHAQRGAVGGDGARQPDRQPAARAVASARWAAASRPSSPRRRCRPPASTRSASSAARLDPARRPRSSPTPVRTGSEARRESLPIRHILAGNSPCP